MQKMNGAFDLVGIAANLEVSQPNHLQKSAPSDLILTAKQNSCWPFRFSIVSVDVESCQSSSRFSGISFADVDTIKATTSNLIVILTNNPKISP